MSAEADRGLLQGRAVKTIHHSSVGAKGRDRGPTDVRLTRLSGGQPQAHKTRDMSVQGVLDFHGQRRITTMRRDREK